LENGIGEGIFKVGTGQDVTIRELAETVMSVVGFKGEIVFDASKPDGIAKAYADFLTRERVD